MSRRGNKSKEKPVVPEEGTEVAFQSKNGARKKRERNEPSKEEIKVPLNSSSEQPQKRIKVQSFYEAEWSTLFELFVQERSHEELKRLVTEVFMHFSNGMFEEETVVKIVDYISARYHDNYYHSFIHATHVVMNVSHYLLNIQPSVDHHFSRVEKLAMLYAALIHDVDHFGVTNAELIQKKHKYAKQYHDQSVAEMRSLAIGLELLEKKGYELLKNWSEEDRVRFRSVVIDLVLCTDIADVWKKKLTYLRFQEGFVPSSSSSSETSSSQNGYNISDANSRVSFLMVAIRSADVGSSMQSSNTFHLWAKNFFDEISHAANHGRGTPVQLDSYCINQIGYLDGHSRALVERLISANILNANFTNTLLENITRNIEDWKQNGQTMFYDWVERHVEREGSIKTSRASTNTTKASNEANHSAEEANHVKPRKAKTAKKK